MVPATDPIWMSLFVFLPTAFALVLLFFPKGWEEAMRWWSLFGTALTLGVSLCVLILFKAQVVDRYPATDKAVAAKQTLLERASPGFDAPAGKEHNSEDW